MSDTDKGKEPVRDPPEGGDKEDKGKEPVHNPPEGGDKEDKGKEPVHDPQEGGDKESQGKKTAGDPGSPSEHGQSSRVSRLLHGAFEWKVHTPNTWAKKQGPASTAQSQEQPKPSQPTQTHKKLSLSAVKEAMTRKWQKQGSGASKGPSRPSAHAPAPEAQEEQTQTLPWESPKQRARIERDKYYAERKIKFKLAEQRRELSRCQRDLSHLYGTPEALPSMDLVVSMRNREKDAKILVESLEWRLERAHEERVEEEEIGDAMAAEVERLEQPPQSVQGQGTYLQNERLAHFDQYMATLAWEFDRSKRNSW